MRRIKWVTTFLLSIFTIGINSEIFAQTISKDELIFLTSEWKGERFADGRPKIPDELLVRAKNINIDDAWTVIKNEGYTNQFEGNFKTVQHNVAVIGRAVTAMFMPSRPDIEKNIKGTGHCQTRQKRQHQCLAHRNTYKRRCICCRRFWQNCRRNINGFNFANSIFSKSGNGVVFNGSARDLQEMQNIKGFNAFVRDFHPSFFEEMVLMGLNTPVRIGGVMVLPGDLVIAQVKVFYLYLLTLLSKW